ncbi:MAG TPA: hypothetical protein VJR58_08455, partial [Vineibacter sp.]|nr:hypothetical protein [Vineibacter sp.]
MASSAGGNVSLRSASPLAIGDGGITTPAGISLISDGALTIAGSLSAGTSTTPGAPSVALLATDIQQTGGGITTPGTLQAVATAGSVQLPPLANGSVVNTVGTVTGSATGGDFFYRGGTGPVTLGALSLVGGSGTIQIFNGGDIVIADRISVNNETGADPAAVERGVYLFSQAGAVRGLAGSAVDINPIDGNSILGGVLTVEAFGGAIDLSATPVSAYTVRFLAPSASVNIDNANNAINLLGASQGGTTAGSISVANTQQLAIFIDLSATTIDISAGGPLFVSANVAGSSAVTLTSTAGGITQSAGTISGPTVSLNASGASAGIVQTGGRIAAGALIATAPSGAVDLVSATNDVASVSGAAGTNFRYVDANAVNLGISTTFDGSFGTVTVISGITVGVGGFVDIAANQITLTSGLSATGPGTTETVVARIGAVTGTGADNPTGVTVLRPTTDGTPMLVGGTSGSGLTQDLLVAGIRTSTLRIGSIGRAAGSVLGGATIAGESTAGAITVQGLDFSGAGALLQRLVLESGAAGVAIQQNGPIRLTRGGPFEGALATAVRGSGSVELTNPNNSVTGLAHVARESDTTLATQSGTFRYVDESSIPVISVAGSGTPLIGQRDSGTAPGGPANSAILTAGGDVTLVSRSGSIEFLSGLAAVGATVRLSAAGDIFQSTIGGVVANGLLAVAGGAVDLSAAAGLNNVRFLSGAAAGASEGLGDFRLINAASVTVPAGGVAGDSLVTTVAGVHAGFGATLELAIGTGDIVVNNTSLTAADGLVLLRRVAGATGSEIILNNVSFDTGSGAPNLVVLDLTGSPALSS